MLRVGLTGSLGSGKSTAAQMFAAHGAHVLSSDEVARNLMQPGLPVYAAIVERFGPSVVAPGGQLDRAALTRIAFQDGRIEELNAIIHPPTIARQAQLIAEIAAHSPEAVVLVESALIFETKYSETKPGNEIGHNDENAPAEAGGWHKRFDRLILIRASEDRKLARFVARASGSAPLTPETRSALEAEGRRRLARQIDDDRKAALSDYVLINNDSLDDLRTQIDALWPILQAAAKSHA